MSEIEFDGNFLRIGLDVNPDYFDFTLPNNFNVNAEEVIKWWDFQQTLVPKLYNDTEVWGIHNLDDYNEFVSLCINHWTVKDAERLHSKNRSPYTSTPQEVLSRFIEGR